MQQGLRLISLGGDHAITYPILKAFHRVYPHLTILHFDARPDLYDNFEGNRDSHACPFARIMEKGLAQRLVQLGLRTLNPHQRAQSERFGVEIVEMKDWREDRVLAFDTPVYLSFDLDGLDPAFAPGVSHHEPGGPVGFRHGKPLTRFLRCRRMWSAQTLLNTTRCAMWRRFRRWCAPNW